MKKNNYKGYIKIFIILYIASFLSIHCGVSEASESKDLILILDTSLSMAGYGGKNILPQVKKSLPVYIDQLEEDDSISFMNFDTVVKQYPTVYIDDENDKDILKKYISMIDASGKWTYTSNMVKSALKKAQELEDRDKDRQRVIVVMTDAIDDPPPGKRKDKLDISKIAENYKGKDWFIFFINFGDNNKNKKLIALQKQLTKDVTEFTKLIEPDENLETDESLKKIIEEDISKNIQKMSEVKREKSSDSTFNSSLLVLLIILIVLISLIYIRRYFELRVTGKLEFWDHTKLKPYITNFDLTKLHTRQISVGKNGSLRISEIEINIPFLIKAIRDNGEIKMILKKGGDYDIVFSKSDHGAFLENEDIFKVANYSFKYTV